MLARGGSATTPPVDDPFPILYQQTGTYDADFQVRVEADGVLTVEGGSYITRGRRAGRLGPRDLARLRRLAAAVEAREWGAPMAPRGSRTRSSSALGVPRGGDPPPTWTRTSPPSSARSGRFDRPAQASALRPA